MYDWIMSVLLMCLHHYRSTYTLQDSGPDPAESLEQTDSSLLDMEFTPGRLVSVLSRPLSKTQLGLHKGHWMHFLQL